jgi:energy-coupling factor transporter ATP-binding protein EcfA2
MAKARCHFVQGKVTGMPTGLPCGITTLRYHDRSGVQMTGDPLQLGAVPPGGSGSDLDRFSETVDVPAVSSDAERPSQGSTAVRVRTGTVASIEGFLGKTLPWRQAAEFVTAIAELLAPLHSRGGCHGSINPTAILVGEDGTPELANPGSSSGGGKSRVVYIGPCTAPERIRVDPLPADSRSDVYGLGVILYHMLCSRYPFRSADEAELCRQIEEDAPQPPRQLAHGVPPEMERICLRMLSKDPAARPANGEDLARELRAVLAETESFDKAPPASSGAAALRTAASAARGSEMVLVVTWDGSMLDKAAVVPTIERLQSSLRDYAARCEGSVLRQSGAATVMHLPMSAEKGAGLPALLGGALKFLAGIAPADSPVGFSVHTAQPDAAVLAGSSKPAEALCHGLKRVALCLQGAVSPSGLEVRPSTMEVLDRWLPCRAKAGSENVFEVAVGPAAAQASTASQASTEEGGLSAESDLAAETGAANRGVGHVIAVRVVNPDPDPDATAAQWPLVGRASQLAILKSRWDQAREGMGQIVLLIGDEGSGKTRLLRELRGAIASASEPVQWIQWSCRPGQMGQSFHPAAEFLRRVCQGSHAADAIKQIGTFLDQSNAASPDTLTLFATLLQLPASTLTTDVRRRLIELEELTAAQRRDRCQQLLLEWLKQVATASPLVFVVEDLQWVDPATLALVQALVDQGLSKRVLTILTFRPEFETPWGSRAHQTQVAISRLTKRHATSIFSAITGQTAPPPEVIDELMSVSEGIPLYIESFALLDSHRQIPSDT